MLDITPFTLEEIEKWVFRTYRVLFYNLDPALRSALREIVDSFVSACNRSGNIGKIQAELDRELSVFNSSSMLFFNQGVLARAQAGAKLYISNIDGACAAKVWVDYTGITQAEADLLPRSLQRTLYDEYLQGFKSFEKTKYSNPRAFVEILKNIIRDTTRKFKGKPINKSTADQIRDAIVNCGLIDKAGETQRHLDSSRGYYFTIEIDHGSLHKKTHLTVDVN
jgi:hypothetical protein